MIKNVDKSKRITWDIVNNLFKLKYIKHQIRKYTNK